MAVMNDFLGFCEGIDKDFASTKKLTFKRAYNMWLNVLTERVINIFKWKGLPFDQKEVEILLAMRGFCGVTKFKKSGDLGAVYGSMSGVTNYPDEYINFLYATPKESGLKKIGKNLVLVNNNQLRTTSMQVVQTYAVLLAHVDLSLQAILINSRATGLIKASTQQQVESVSAWYKGLMNGKTMAVLNDEDLEKLMGDKGIEVFPMQYSSSFSIDAYYQIRENLLKSFYSEFGINSNREKRERIIEAELDTNLNRILFNVSDMLEQRKDAAKQITEIFGVEISVDLNPEIIAQYNIEGKAQVNKKEGVDNGSSND